MKRQKKNFKDRYKLDLGFKIGLNEKLTRCKHVYLIQNLNLSSTEFLNTMLTHTDLWLSQGAWWSVGADSEDSGGGRGGPDTGV